MMKRNKLALLLAVLCMFAFFTPANAMAASSIVVAAGQDVPTDDHLDEDYRFPQKYRDNAVQFVTEDGILLCGYVLGEGSKGITLGHPNGWMVKSWLPFAERLVAEGYLVILWEFRGLEPSGMAYGEHEFRWDLDVLAAAQVLRDYGATEIICMGASDGGTATAIAAPDIPELAALAILSSPSKSFGDAVEAIGKIKDVPAFFAVSTNDSFGDFYPHVEALYEACASTQKQFHVIEGADHGTDMIMPNVPGLGYATFPADDEHIQKRQDLADKLMLFVNEAFGDTIGQPGEGKTEQQRPIPDKTVVDSDLAVSAETADQIENNTINHDIYIVIAGLGLVVLLIFSIILIKK